MTDSHHALGEVCASVPKEVVMRRPDSTAVPTRTRTDGRLHRLFNTRASPAGVKLWILIFVIFIAMHLGMHGGHGGHNTHVGGDSQQSKDEKKRDEAEGRAVNTSSGGHQH